MKTILCLVLALVSFSAVYGQGKTVQKAEFETLLKNAAEIFKAKPHRVTVTSESTINGKPQEEGSAKTVVEVAGMDKRRSIREYKSRNQNQRREFIRYGDKTYSRENEGQWKQGGTPNNQTEGNLKTISEQVQYELLGKETLNGANVNVYRRTKESKMIDNSNSEEVQSTEIVKYWFGENGALLKREMERENRRSGKIFRFKVTATFDLDSNIQVVAPPVAGN